MENSSSVSPNFIFDERNSFYEHVIKLENSNSYQTLIPSAAPGDVMACGILDYFTEDSFPCCTAGGRRSSPEGLLGLCLVSLPVGFVVIGVGLAGCGYRWVDGVQADGYRQMVRVETRERGLPSCTEGQVSTDED